MRLRSPPAGNSTRTGLPRPVVAMLAGVLVVAVCLIAAAALGARLGSQSGTSGLTVVAGGDIAVDGDAGAVLAIAADVTIVGTVERLVALESYVIVADGGAITGPVHTTRPIGIEPGAAVGPINEIGGTTLGRGLSGPWGLVTSVAFTVSLLAVGAFAQLLAPVGLDAAHRAGTDRPMASMACGLVIAITVPVAAIAAAVTVIGLPLAAFIASTFVILGALGFVVSARVLGGVVLGDAGSPLAAITVGLLLLGLGAVMPLLAIAIPVASTFGLGAMGAAAFTHPGAAIR